MTTFSPVTESEMNEFFARISATVRDYTQLSDRLAELDRRNTETNERLNTLVSENEVLRSDIKAATDLAGQAEQERDEARRSFEAERGRSSNLSDLIMARDSRVSELTYDITIINEDRESLNNECRNLSDRVTSLEVDLKHTASRRDYWREFAEKNDRALKEALADLKEVQDMVGRLAIFKPKEEPKKVEITEGKPDSHQIALDHAGSTQQAPEMKPVIHEDQVDDPNLLPNSEIRF